MQGGDRHDPAVGIGQGGAGLVRLGLAGALQDDAGDDLQAVGDPVLDLLQQDRLFAQQVVLQLLAGPGFGDVRHPQQQADRGTLAIGEQMGVQQQAADASEARALQIHFIGFDIGGTGQGGGQQGPQPGQVPLAFAEAQERLAHRARGVDLEAREEGGAGGDDIQVAVEQHQRRSR